MRDERVILRERGIRKNYTKKPKVKLIRLVIILPSSIALLFVLQFPLIRLSFDYANTQLRWAPWSSGMRCLSPWWWIRGFRPGRSFLPPAYLTQPPDVSACHDVWWCALFINSTSFSHWFYIIRTFRLTLNQCWHSTRGTTGLIVRHNNIHLSPFKKWTLFPATIWRIWLQTHSHITSH